MKLSEVLTKEELDLVTEKLGEDLKLIKSKLEGFVKEDTNSIPKYRFDEVVKQKNDYKTEADNFSKELNKIKKSAGDNEELASKIETLQKSLKDKEAEFQNKETEITKRFALRESLRDSQAKFPDLLEGKFNLDELELTPEGKIKDFEIKLTPVKEKYKDLFGETKRVGTQPNMDVKNPSAKTEIERLKEQLKIAQENYKTAEAISIKRQIAEAEKGE